MYGSTARRSGARAGRRAAAVATLVVGAGTVGIGPLTLGIASAATPIAITDANFTWSLSTLQTSGAYAGGCNFLSAGAAGNTGSSTYWSTTNPTPGYSSQLGNVTIEKPNSGGTYAQPTWATKCQGPTGAALTPATSSSTRIAFAAGVGTADPAANTASIQWTGSFTSVFYGGLSYWSATDPKLTVAADGTGTLTATLSGYAADRDNPGQWTALTPTVATLATLHGVVVTATGFTVTPDYLGVAVTTPSGGTAQSTSGTSWGSFPQSFVDFQQLTGQSSFWYSSGSGDAAKVVTPVTVSYLAAVPADLPEVATPVALVGAAALVAGAGVFTIRRRRNSLS